MKKSCLFLLFLNVITACESEKKEDFTGVWVAPAPIQEGIFYQPTLIAAISPDRMTLFEDVNRLEEYSWEINGETLKYFNETEHNTLEIIEKSENQLVLSPQKGDTLTFFKMDKGTSINDAAILSALVQGTFEMNVGALNWNLSRLVFEKNGRLILFKNEGEKRPLEVGTWHLMNIWEHYFLFISGLHEEKPILVAVSHANEFEVSGQLFFAKTSYAIDFKLIGANYELAEVQNTIIGRWDKYNFKSDSSFIAVQNRDTITGNWRVNSTGELVLMNAGKDLQIGFLNPNFQSINFMYYTDFFKDFATNQIKKIN